MSIHRISVAKDGSIKALLYVIISKAPQVYFLVCTTNNFIGTHEQVYWLKSWHDQLFNQAPCQGKLVNF